MKNLKAWLISWRYWFSGNHVTTCGFIGTLEYSKFLNEKLGYGDAEWDVLHGCLLPYWRCEFKTLRSHRDFKHMTPWQLRHARRKLIYEFFSTRSE